jgi:hypothetical protein
MFKPHDFIIIKAKTLKMTCVRLKGQIIFWYSLCLSSKSKLKIYVNCFVYAFSEPLNQYHSDNHLILFRIEALGFFIFYKFGCLVYTRRFGSICYTLSQYVLGAHLHLFT